MGHRTGERSLVGEVRKIAVEKFRCLYGVVHGVKIEMHLKGDWLISRAGSLGPQYGVKKSL